MRDLQGLDVVVSCRRKTTGTIIGQDDNDVLVSAPEDDGYPVVIDELFGDLVGFDMKEVTPYLSSFARGFDHGSSSKESDAERKVREDREQREKEQALADSRRKGWVIVSLVGVALAAVIGGVVYFARKK